MIQEKDFVSKQDEKNFLEYISSPDFPWFLHKKTILLEKTGSAVIKENYKEDLMFVHTLYRNGKPSSDLYDYFLSIFTEFCKKFNIEYKAILRAKVNLNISSDSDPQPAPAHVDFDFSHKVFIYYFNDSDGDTIIYNEKFGEDISKPLTEKIKISPEMGRAIVFDGLHYHSPTPPKNGLRFVLNIAFL